MNTRKDRDPQEIYGLPPSQELAEGLEAKAKSRETSIQYFVGVTLTVGCGAARNSAAGDPLKCERDPNCKSHERAFDCSAQCTDDPACMDRCNQVQEQTGTSAPH